MADDIIFLLEGNIHFKGSLKLLKSNYKSEKVEEAIAKILEDKNYEFSANGHIKNEADLKVEEKI